MDMNLISVIVGIFGGLGVLFFGIGSAYSQIKMGGDKYKDNLIDTLKESIAILEEKNRKQTEERTTLILSHQTQLTELNKQLGILQGKFEEQNKKIEEYKKILQGKNPEQTKLLEDIKEVLTQLNRKSSTNELRNNKLDRNPINVTVNNP